MKKIALALAITSALASHFAFAGAGKPGDGEAPELKTMVIDADQESQDRLNKVRANAGNAITKDSTVKTEKTANSVPVSDVGVYNALKAMDEGRLKEIQRDIQRGNEINGRILANAVSGEIKKDNLQKAKKAAIAMCTKPLAIALAKPELKAFTEGTSLEKAVKLDTSSPENLAKSLTGLEEALNGFNSFMKDVNDVKNTVDQAKSLFDQTKKAIDNPGQLLNQAVNAGQGMMQEKLNKLMGGNAKVDDLTKLDFNQFNVFSGHVNTLSNLSKSADLILNTTSSATKNETYLAVKQFNHLISDKANSSFDREEVAKATKEITDECARIESIATNLSDKVKAEVSSTDNIREATLKALQDKCSAQTTKLDDECVKFYKLGTTQIHSGSVLNKLVM